MATLRQILVVVLAAVALADGFVVRKPENVHRERRSGKAGRSRALSTTSATQQAYTVTSISNQEATTQYPSYDTTYGYGTSSYPWNYETLLAGIPGKILQPIVPTKQLTTTIQIATTVPFSPYQTTDYDYSNSYYSTISPYQTSNSKNWNNYYTTNSPYQTSNSENWNNYYTTNSPYQTSNSDNWNNYYTTNSPYQTSNSDNWNNYYTTNSPWRYETPYNDWNYYYTTYSPWNYENTYPWNRWNRYDYWTTQSPNRYNQEGLLEALAVDVVAEAREVVSGAEETLEKANDLEDAVFRANGEEGPRVYLF
ncbi:GATA zinc finger domain-containing protein 4-like [Pomacea canaliculata]|uniref:GATA zinc finger domain-containing protein 4-like n=1 Tax=Pomacea canaliculata TaxID=400727 RepID=UPI000D73CF8C|nr:GATA zinc finger domain-containing protein 4-like [Pomacea canaliculata]